MEKHTTADPEHELEHDADELEERIEKLDEQIEESKKELRARREDTDPAEDVAGDWEDTDDDAGGQDPAGFDDPDELANEEDEEG